MSDVERRVRVGAKLRFLPLAVSLGWAGCGGGGEPNAETPPAPAGGEAAGATAPAEPEGPPPLPRPTDPAAFVGQHVLVPDGATVYLGPEADAATVTLRLPPSVGEHAPTPTGAMTVLAHEGGRLQVKPAGAGERCTPELTALASVDVALWVEPSALSRVLGRAVEASFADGTSVKLRPGTPVGAPGERVEVVAHELRLAVPIDEGDVSTLYGAVDPIVVPTGGDKLVGLAPGAPLTYAGGDPVLPESALLGGGLVLARRTDGDKTFARVASQCAEVEALVDPVRLEAPAAPDPDADEPTTPKGRYAINGPGGDPVLARRSGVGPRWEIGAGKALTWPSGAAAGTTKAALELTVAPTAKGDRQCFSVPWIEPTGETEGEVEGLPLCAAAADVTKLADPMELAMGSGILGMLAADPGAGAFGATAMFGSDLDDADLYGGLVGSKIGDEFGVGGLGMVGTGRGGGGTGEGTIGLGTLGGGGGGGGGFGSGSTKTAKAKVGKVTATGLDAKDTGRSIAKHGSQLRYCYEKELVSDPDLDGALTLSLTVDGGVVTSASASGTLPESMRLCVERSAKRWKLDGSGSVTVPVTFSAG